jgi:alpha-glucosidase
MHNLKWWQTAVFYQIYPRSFADGNGDGVGDFAGMTERLDYLQDLGVDALWLSPHYPSPQADCGYDVADYTDVNPEYGTLAEFKTFLAEAHRRGLRVILDMVLNHSSDQHRWFLESRSGRDAPRRNWYIWRDGEIGPEGERRPPNNWESCFVGPAWTYDEGTDQYYYHFFLKEQPDLNWRTPEVKAAMWDAVRFWLDLGVDGFRLDAVTTIFEAPGLPDHTSAMTLAEIYRMGLAAEDQVAPEVMQERGAAPDAMRESIEALFRHQTDQPEVHPLMRELRAVVDAYDGRVLVGEEDDVAYYGSGDDELHLVFNFPLMRTDRLTAPHVRENQATRLAALPEGAWPCNTLGNHDAPRVWSHFGDGEHDRALAQLSLAVVLTLRGTPFLYNGEEIGMTDTPLHDLGHLRDTLALRWYDLGVEAMGLPPDQVAAFVLRNTRDVCRTPMQWANAPNAGFCPADVAPWLPVNPNYAEGVNVADQVDDPDAMLNVYKRMLALRKRTPALIAGDYTPLLEDHGDVLCFLRSTEDQTCLVALNFSAEAQTIAPDLDGRGVRRRFSNAPQGAARPGNDALPLHLAPFEVYIAELV